MARQMGGMAVVVACSASPPVPTRVCAAPNCGTPVASERVTVAEAPVASVSPPAASWAPVRPARILLAQLPLTVAPSVLKLAEPRPARLAVDLELDDAGLLEQSELGRRGYLKQTSATSAKILSLAVPASSDAPAAEHRAASFLVDYDQPAVAALLERLKQPALPDDVVRLVARHIENHPEGRGFDVASRVAETRRGDCTEHAVLCAALLRARQIPARVVLGVVVLRMAGEWLAFGHAWVEYHDGANWRIADSALNQGSASPATSTSADRHPQVVGYLPLDLVLDESLSYARGLLDRSVGHVQRASLSVIGP